MSRRPYCVGFHDWKEHRHQGAVELQCSKCPATFPCRESCAHTDCEAHTGRTAVCPVCGKPVTFEEGFHVSSRSKLIRLHVGSCQAAYNAEPEEDPEQPLHQEAA